LQGGVLGPELNAPKNVTEYWQLHDLKAFIRNPESYRYQSKMPAFSHFSDADIDAVLAYLQQMKQQKLVR
jgi:mono/diheme cytochrome c family protein